MGPATVGRRLSDGDQPRVRGTGVGASAQVRRPGEPAWLARGGAASRLAQAAAGAPIPGLPGDDDSSGSVSRSGSKGEGMHTFIELKNRYVLKGTRSEERR